MTDTPTTVTARLSEELSAITDLVHDCWFDIDDIRYDPEVRTLTIPFQRPMPERAIKGARLFGRRRVPRVECFLRIGEVRRWKMVDEKCVGRYDFNEVNYDRPQETINISTGVPLELAVEVDRLDVSVDITDHVVDDFGR
jgi:hypothetical protein